jgi:hypothetical protein
MQCIWLEGGKTEWGMLPLNQEGRNLCLLRYSVANRASIVQMGSNQLSRGALRALAGSDSSAPTLS